jgi:hypothetical protein
MQSISTAKTGTPTPSPTASTAKPDQGTSGGQLLQRTRNDLANQHAWLLRRRRLDQRRRRPSCSTTVTTSGRFLPTGRVAQKNLT